jgi:hypothetical protein
MLKYTIVERMGAIPGLIGEAIQTPDNLISSTFELHAPQQCIEPRNSGLARIRNYE